MRTKIKFYGENFSALDVFENSFGDEITETERH
jgi:hypothetical protein